jgi:hypothetical protein
MGLFGPRTVDVYLKVSGLSWAGSACETAVLGELASGIR